MPSTPSILRQRLLHLLGFHKTYTQPPVGLAWRSHTIFIITTVGIGLFTDLFLYGLIVPILPYLLQDRIGIPRANQQSYVSGLLTAYAGASVFFSPVAGFVADRTSSRQTPFLAGLVLLLLGCLGLYLGETVAALAVARILQGLSAAVVWTVGLSLCIDTVGAENLGKTVGTIFSVTSVGELAAPVLGGVLYKKAGYVSVFWLSAGLLMVDFVMRLLVVEKKVAARYEKAEGTGNGERENEHGQVDGNEEEEGEEQPLLGKNIKEDYKIPPQQGWLIQRLPVLYCFRNPSLLAAMLVAFVQALLLGVIDSTVSTQAEEVLGFDSLAAGLLFLPIGLVNAIVGPIAGWGVDKYGTKPLAVFGYSFLVPVLVALRVIDHNSKEQLILYIVLLALVGVGLATIGAPSIVEAGAVVQRYHEANPDFFGEAGPYAQLYGMNGMVFNLGLAVGPVMAGGLKAGIGYGNMNGVVAGICLGTAMVSFFYIGGRPKSWWPGVRS